MAENLKGFVPFPNPIDFSALEKNEGISNQELKEILLEMHKIIQQTTLAFNQFQSSLSSLGTLTPGRVVLGGGNGYPQSFPYLPQNYFIVGSLFNTPTFKYLEGSTHIQIIDNGDRLTFFYTP